jgi:hypothetical protein
MASFYCIADSNIAHYFRCFDFSQECLVHSSHICQTNKKISLMSSSIVEVDSLEITVIVENEVDVMSAIAPGTVDDSRRLLNIALGESKKTQVGATSIDMMPMESICCGAHGLSVMIVSQASLIFFSPD